MFARHLTSEIGIAFRDTPVVFLNGARQTGKSTLAREMLVEGTRSHYLTLDDAPVLAAAREDPDGFIAGLDGPVVLDEVQRAPDLFLAIKAAVDRERTPGTFLLTGSADVLLLPKVADSLAGRMEIFTLWPLSQGEMGGVKESFVDSLFLKMRLGTGRYEEDRRKLIARVLRGGYPVVQHRESESRRHAWFDSYITSILQRDIRDLSGIEDLTMLPRLLALLATRACGLLNSADLARGIGIPQSTLRRYFTLLETTFLVRLLRPWSVNIGKRLVKAPKLYLNDTGLMTYLLGLDQARLGTDHAMIGSLLENFIIMELRKQISWSKTRPQMFHFRTHTGEEVDIILENAAGEIVGVEVKATASVGASDFKGLRTLSEAAGTRFRRGIVLYTGAETVPFGKNLHAVPIPSLWH